MESQKPILLFKWVRRNNCGKIYVLLVKNLGYKKPQEQFYDKSLAKCRNNKPPLSLGREEGLTLLELSIYGGGRALALHHFGEEFSVNQP